MINKKQTFTFGDVTFSVDPKKPYVTMELNGLKRSIKKNELWTMVFAISKKKQQADLIPVQQKEMVNFVKQVSIRMVKDVKAGEICKFHIPVNIPLTIVQAELTKEEKQELLNATLEPLKVYTEPKHDIPSPFAPGWEKE